MLVQGLFDEMQKTVNSVAASIEEEEEKHPVDDLNLTHEALNIINY